MQLTIGEAAKLLQVTEDTVYKFIREDGLPASRYDERYFLNRVKLVEWATHNQVPLALEHAPRHLALATTLRNGGIFHGIDANTKTEALKGVVAHLPLPPGLSRAFVLEMLLARERGQSTGLGDGIAIPHAEHPLLFQVKKPSVTLCFLRKPIEFGAPDGIGVFALFTIMAPTVASHLQHLSEVAQALSDSEFRRHVQAQADAETLFACLERKLTPADDVEAAS